jgi:signal transduction histidine kinase
VSTYAGQLESVARPGVTTILERRLTKQIVACAGFLAGIGACTLLATSDHLVHPVEYGLLVGNLVVGTTGVALYWLARRPGNPTAAILLVLAAAYSLIALQGSSQPIVHSVGVLFDPVIFVLAYYAVLPFPYGRLVTLLDKLLIATAVFVILTSFLPWFLFSPYVTGGAPLAGCNATCPTNGLMIADRPSIAVGLGRTEQILAALFAVAIVGAIVYRLVRATGPRRRALLPVYVPALLLTVPFGLFQAAGAGLIHLKPTQVSNIGWFLTVGRGTLSYGFLLSILLATMFAGRALKDTVGRLGVNRHPAHLRAVLARALDDASLDVALRDRESGRFVGSAGESFDPTYVPAGQVASRVDRAGEPFAYIVHDAALSADPELVNAAGQAMLLVLETGHLQVELGATIEELETSRARIAAAGDAERRKIERDLHDGAQQHLFALGLKLDSAARDLADRDPSLAQELSDVGAELNQVLDELRQLGRGMYPPLLRERGLEGALASVAWRSARPTSLAAEGVGRYRPEVEATVYFCCLESLQNVARHAGADAQAEIRLWTSNGDLCFAVEDDGVGPAAQPTTEGSGLQNMRDRVAAVGGTVGLEATDPHGTRVVGRVPVHAARGVRRST